MHFRKCYLSNEMSKMSCTICWSDTPKGFKKKDSHRFYICHYPYNFTNVSVHFNENGHTPSGFSSAPVDKVEAEWQQLSKETYRMHRLNTIYLNGMNSIIFYQISSE